MLEGVLHDENAAYCAGTYVRLPPGSRHTPHSEKGCVLFLNAGRFATGDRTQVVIDSKQLPALPDAARPGVAIKTLFTGSHENVSLETWQANCNGPLSAPCSQEIFVLDGELTEGGDTLVRHSWLRLPKGYVSTARAGANGVHLLVKHHQMRTGPNPLQ